MLIVLFLSFVIPAMQFNIERNVEDEQFVSPVFTSEVPQYSTRQVHPIQIIQMPVTRQEIDWVAIKMFFKDIMIDADEIIYNGKTQLGSAKNMVITQVGSGTKIKGSYAKFSLNGKVEIWQNENVVVEP
ncbi:hypothetical protein GCM10008119_03000 [Pedobacter mendelii]|uniref:Uncharacterized protein n=1 Tax=Pedobacter mendelii TaxID=1908240 RepID=A0ABQ2BBW4_9SPHI|nr:hypothetical protein GCM10008119_03000 [Pedobacter mendelii]